MNQAPLSDSSSAVLTSCDILQDGLTYDLEYGPQLHQFCKDAHGRDLQEVGIVSVLLVVISAQVCIRDVWVFLFCMLEPGWDKLFLDYRDWSYMHIVLSYRVCLITNILEITDASSGKSDSFLQSHSMSIVVTWKWIFQDCVLHHSSLLPLI